MLRLFLLFTLVPALELYLLIRLGQWMGPLATVLLIFVTGAVGAFLAKREGLNVIRQLTAELAQGIPPAARLAEGALVLLGGILLITPGILTDLTGFLLIFPPTRRFLAPRVVAFFASRVAFTANGAAFQGGFPRGEAPPGAQDPQHPPRNFPFDHPVR